MTTKQNRRPPSSDIHVLVVNDEPDIRELLEITLTRMGLCAHCVPAVRDARDALAVREYALCLTDMRLPDEDGLTLVRYMADKHPRTPVAVITAHGNTENAVAALKSGAFDYVAKPLTLEQLRSLVRSALNLPKSFEAEGKSDYQLLGNSPMIEHVRATIEKLARTQAPVHLTGESGTGKELAARRIHELGARKDAPFIAVNCGAIPENLMESEFFGYRKGSFTGAEADRTGFFQAAHGGTLFLDEVADLPLSMQVKLLRAIQEKRVRKIGATQEEPVDVRILSATHQDLKALSEAGKFRLDLYYRLNVIELRMPALRECPEDIPLLAATILDRLANTSGLPRPKLTESALKSLTQYDFPGNVRELENMLERALALCAKGTIQPDDLRLHPLSAESDDVNVNETNALQDHLDELEKRHIMEALQKTRYNRTAAAKLLGVTFRSLRYRMERLGLKE